MVGWLRHWHARRQRELPRQRDFLHCDIKLTPKPARTAECASIARKWHVMNVIGRAARCAEGLLACAGVAVLLTAATTSPEANAENKCVNDGVAMPTPSNSKPDARLT
jgi:hypothetical protein